MIIKSPLDLHIGKKLKSARTMAGMTLIELGELIGLTTQQIQKYENGYNRIYASRLYEISQILSKPISSFFEGYVDNKNYYNFEFKEEQDHFESEEIKNKEITNLIKAFNKIENYEIRRSTTALLKAIADISE